MTVAKRSVVIYVLHCEEVPGQQKSFQTTLLEFFKESQNGVVMQALLHLKQLNNMVVNHGASASNLSKHYAS